VRFGGLPIKRVVFDQSLYLLTGQELACRITEDETATNISKEQRSSMKECAMSQTLLEMVKDLVLAQIYAHELPPEEMHKALKDTYVTLYELQRQEDVYGSVTVEPYQPVNWRNSITQHSVTCLVCNARFKQLSAAHLRIHGLDARSYRQRYRIPPQQPLAAREVTAQHRRLARQQRPWEKAPRYIQKQERAKQAAAEKTGQAPKRASQAKRKAVSNPSN
jgi:predicted transcriptional regulator